MKAYASRLETDATEYEYEVSWTVKVTVDPELDDEPFDIAAVEQAFGLMAEAVSHGEGATIVALRQGDRLIGRYDISYDTPRIIGIKSPDAGRSAHEVP